MGASPEIPCGYVLKPSSQVLSQTRCVIMRDAGYTRADMTNNKYCCLFFARGCCPYGHECNFLHRLPLPNRMFPFISLPQASKV